MTITKFWRCPKCGFLTTNEEMQSITFDPECRCYEETGMTWARFIPVIEKDDNNTNETVTK
jgi:hypothetical protein